MSEVKPKKRGRKPKNIDLNKKKEKIEKPEITENLIIKLKTSEIDTYQISGFDTKKDICEKVENETKSEVCWNCCHSFNNHVYGIPLKYINKIFYTYGDFCSLECAARYTIEYMNDYNFSEIFSLINLYNSILFNKTEKIEIAPSKLLLKKFGGDLTIDEYRNHFETKNLYDVRMPPILPIKHSINKYEINNTSQNTNLKLFRKKPLPSEKKSITSSMNLIIN